LLCLMMDFLEILVIHFFTIEIEFAQVAVFFQKLVVLYIT